MNDIFTSPKITPRAFSLLPFKIIESEHVLEQFRFPRTKKRRIRNKWAKRPENLRPRRGFLEDKNSGVCYVHPETMRRLEKQLGQAMSRHIEQEIIGRCMASFT